MKKNQLFLTSSFLSAIILLACQKSVHQDLGFQQSNSLNTVAAANTSRGEIPLNAATCDPTAYVVTLESHTQVGANWEWIWSVQNSNPGNGNGGTFQDLSHWGMQFGPCNVMSSVVGAAYSANGTTWTSFTPLYQIDPSQGCMTTPVFKFDYGTTGSAKSFYKLVLNQNFYVGVSVGYYKSGSKTGCCTFTFDGISCSEDGDIR
jgi:hypothetical protein